MDDAPRRRQHGGAGNAADTCLYGSVVGMDALLRVDIGGDGVDAGGGGGTTSPMCCDECEQQRARVECEDCGLVYCAPCDAHRHRKGKLLFHQRKRLSLAAVASVSASVSDTASTIAALSSPQPEHQQDDEDQQSDGSGGVLLWSVDQVSDWLRDHDLELFVADIMAHSVNGAFLLSNRMDEFLEAHCSSASRSHKKKLQREIQKLKADQSSDSGSGNSLNSKLKMLTPMKNVMVNASERDQSPYQPAQQIQPQYQPNTARRLGLGMNLRVNVNTSPASTTSSAAPLSSSSSEQSFSPVTSLRSRIVHGQADETRGRINRRRSVLSPTASSSAASTPKRSLLSVNTVDEPAKRGSGLFAQGQPRIEVKENALLTSAVPAAAATQEQSLSYRSRMPPPPPILETRPSGRADLRANRQALVGGLDLDIMQVKKEERSVEASFDFSAEGRLQTQGFEINTHGIANVPFPHRHTSKKAAMGTREYLVVLNELGHGAGGKVYKALYMPTFKLLAVKVIRVYDQKKRHQMVRELKSLYVNFVAINDTAGRAACEELVVFYDAYTNPEVGSVSIVLEFMDKGSLEDHLQSGRRVSEKELASMAHCVLKGLAFLHEHHQLHRDIKLSNMLINNQGQVKISDFGISRDLESTLAKATTFTGTLLYMAPERISGGMYSYPSDIWSFGLAIMALAIGKLPVPTKEGYWGVVHAVQEQPSPKLADYGDHFSPTLCEFIDLCLQKNPMHRPPAAILLEHAFIKENYSPRQDQRSTRGNWFAAEGEDTGNVNIEKSLKELEHMAGQVRTWCVNHADTLLSPTATSSLGSQGVDGSLFQQISNQERIELLAQQLHLPIESVASKFAFMSEYCG